MASLVGMLDIDFQTSEFCNFSSYFQIPTFVELTVFEFSPFFCLGKSADPNTKAVELRSQPSPASRAQHKALTFKNRTRT